MALSVSIELVSLSARITSVKSHKGVLVTDGHPDPKIGPQVYLGPIKIGPKNPGMGTLPPPIIWAMPERKRFFPVDVFPNNCQLHPFWATKKTEKMVSEARKTTSEQLLKKTMKKY